MTDVRAARSRALHAAFHHPTAWKNIGALNIHGRTSGKLRHRGTAHQESDGIWILWPNVL
jgi:hypothetical protein